MQWRGTLVAGGICRRRSSIDLRLKEFVEAINDVNNQAADGGTAVPPSPLPIPDPLTRESSKEALLDYARVGTADPFGTTCLPCTASEFGRAIGRLVDLNHYPWTHYIIRVGGTGNVLPVSDLCVPKARTNTLEPALDPRPNGLWNIS
ncbi:Inositol-3-phosphate synthase [Phytophthora palmivora]|uniref:Inositol-3-phosphate synthase n=1 Tax=Phytophthora palmivora TaxID=4796 RepID=A0A2P4X7A8_9STRA|nr:Inositol-3-phosphate synthase [Phytophthora palmivora]